MNNKQVADAFAKRTKERANGSHFYFEGNTVYSYGSHFPIARFVTNTKGETVALFTMQDYSSTTQRHKSLVTMALYYANVRTLPLHDLTLPCAPGRFGNLTCTHYGIYTADALETVAQLHKAAQKARDKAARSWVYKELHLADAQKAEENAQALLAFFELAPVTEEVPA